MKKEYLSVFLWLICTALFKQILWLGIVPIWQFPDESAHFAYVQNISEFGLKKPSYSSDEIAFSHKMLGTYPDEQGLNKYSFNPGFNIEYTATYYGLHEREIKNAVGRQKFEEGLKEPADYPFLYYLFSSFFYNVFYYSDLITRVFAVRFLAVILFTLTVWVSFLIGMELFKEKVWAIALASLVAFHPMLSFVGAAVNSDSLFNFLFTVFIYGCLRMISRSNGKSLAIVVGSMAAGFATKPQMIVSFLILPTILVLKSKSCITFIKSNILAVSAIFTFLIFLIAIGFRGGYLNFAMSYIAVNTDSGANIEHFFSYLKESLIHTYRLLLPWYWGAYKWLGVTLPRSVNRVQMSILLITVLGLFHYLWLFSVQCIKSKKIHTEGKLVLFLCYVSFIYYFAIIFWDWRFSTYYGGSFGLQGRYFFPAISAHMALIAFSFKKWGELIAKRVGIVAGILVSWWIIIHFVGLYTLSQAYFETSSFQTFLLQVSQYKPAIFKGNWWFTWFGIVAIEISVFYCWYMLLIRSSPKKVRVGQRHVKKQ
ncbi:MAG: DUF2142 domain-containing protein [Patescibacteria group bacterium]|jgi:hypothetical protein